MKVCIVIPNYGHSKYLQRCIESAVSQTYHDIEILVIDDGSPDSNEVESIVRKMQQLDDRISFVSLPQNFGKWHVMNEACRTTNCDLITTLDADDVCPPDRIERQVQVFHAIPNTLHVLTGFWHCWSNDELEENVKNLQSGPLKIVPAEDVRNMVMAGKFTPGINHYFTGNIETAGASAMFRKAVWDLGIRFNPPRLGLRVLLSEDSDFNFRVTALLGQTVILNEKLYCYRRNTSTNEEAM